MPLKLYRRGKLWHYRGTIAGRRLRAATGSPDRDIASKIAANVEARAWKCHTDGPQAVLTFSQAALLYRAAGKPTRFLLPLADYWRDTVVRDITAGAVRAAALALHPTASNATRNRQVIAPAQAIINHAAESELCPRLSIKRFPVTTRMRTPATWDWVAKFMAASPPHLAALACFLFTTGARISEALALAWDDIDLTARTVLIRQSKTESERIAHLPSPLVIALANVAPIPSRTVFRYTTKCAADKSWRAACRRAAIPVLSFHCCRHGFATALLQAGVDPVTVAKLGGWKSPQHVFKTYGHASDDRTLTDRICAAADTPLTQQTSAAAKVSKRSKL